MNLTLFALLSACQFGLTEKPQKETDPRDTQSQTDSPTDSGFHPIDTGDHDDTNHRPVASAGDDQEASVDAVVKLDGSGSTDEDGDTLQYAWTLAEVPTGSATRLLNSTRVDPEFMVDVEGIYKVDLVVSDGELTSEADRVVISGVSRNTAPTANAGSAQTVTVGDMVRLDGTGSSDPEGDTLTYTWSLLVKPAGSTATLSGPTSPTPSFVADKEGQFNAQLIVNDGKAESAPDTVMVTARASGGDTSPSCASLPVTGAGAWSILGLGSWLALWIPRRRRGR